MPDLKSEMSKVLEAWEQDVEQLQQESTVRALPQQFKPTNNVSRETFYYVRNNPQCTAKQICDALQTRGFNRASVGSLIAQFLKQDFISRDDNSRYTAVVNEYTPVKSTKKFRSEGKRINKIVTKPKSAGIAALQVDTTPKAVPTKVVTQWDADTIINNIGLKQARALYDELKKIFGG